jgi:hypothetical protein
MVARYRNSERGMSLMIVLLVMMLLSALMIGFMANIMADTRSSGVDRDETQAYAVAHAGMEKLTSDLAALFSKDYSPNGTQITAVADKKPTMAGFTYTDPDGSTGYKIQFTAKVGGVNTTVATPTTAIPVPDDPTTGTTIAAGPYQGFKGLVTHYNIMVTARSNGGSEVRMRRELQTVAVPVFQFGLFSENSLSFHAGSDFNFGGRVHTNGNLFLAAGGTSTLTLGDKVTAVGEVIRRYLDNGELSTTRFTGTVNMAKGTGVYRALSATNNSNKGEGSLVGDLGSAQNETTWTNLSIGTYNGYIRNGRTGAKRLDLPLVTNGASPIDLIRRPPASEDVNKPLVYQQRYYTSASLRILLSDTAADITGLPGVTATAPVNLEAALGLGPASIGGAPVATSSGSGQYKSTLGVSLIGGYIKIEKQDSAGAWTDVTGEVLGLGIAGRNLSNGTLHTAFTGSNGQNSTTNTCLATEPQPNAVVRLERVKDVPSTHSTSSSKYDCAVTGAGVMSVLSSDYWPLALYDTREGLRRDETAPSKLYPAGVMYYVELDTANLARWFRGTIGTTGTVAKNDNGGYIVYFSDRRNNRNASDATSTADPRLCDPTPPTPPVPCFPANAETGEFGYEDIVNFTTAGGADDTVMNTTTRGEKPEDMNADGTLETYGKMPNDGKGTYNSVATIGASSPLDSSLRPTTQFNNDDNGKSQLRGNRPLLFRRALKLTNGGNLRTSGISGLTIASENPVYVQGNYNSTATDTPTETHIAAAIIADAITTLSNAWNDIASFNTGSGGNGHLDMTAADTGYRFASVLGKSISFLQPTTWTTFEDDFGNDGGANNLVRLQEDWGGYTMYYRGSIVSFYISRQATGIYKCCTYTYGVPSTRVYNFDTDFLLPDKLPPGTPMFRDVNTLTFRQILRPNQ